MADTDRVTAYLAEVRRDPLTANVPALAAALTRVLALAVEWEKTANDLSAMTGGASLRGQAHQDLATALQATISAALLGEEADHG